MTATIRRADYFYTTVPDRPGEGVLLLERLKETGLDLLAFSAFPVPEGRTQVDFVPADTGRFLEAARKAGISLSGKKLCFLVEGAESFSALAAIVRPLSDAGISITALDSVRAAGGRHGAILWVGPASYEKAARVLGI